MSAAANCDRQFVVAPEVHGGDHVGGVGATRDHERPFVDHGVIKFAGLFIFGMGPFDQNAAQPLGELCDCPVIHGSAPEAPVNQSPRVYRLAAVAKMEKYTYPSPGRPAAIGPKLSAMRTR